MSRYCVNTGVLILPATPRIVLTTGDVAAGLARWRYAAGWNTIDIT